MATPKRKVSRKKRDSRRSHWLNNQSPSQLVNCPSCGERKRAHYACTSCDTYKGRKITGKTDNAE